MTKPSHESELEVQQEAMLAGVESALHHHRPQGNIQPSEGHGRIPSSVERRSSRKTKEEPDPDTMYKTDARPTQTHTQVWKNVTQFYLVPSWMLELVLVD